MNINLGKKVMGFLKSHPNQKFTNSQIAEGILKNYPEECRQKAQRSTSKLMAKATTAAEKDKAVMQQIRAEISLDHYQYVQRQDPGFKTIEEHPRKFYYTSQTDQQEVVTAETEGNIIDSPSKIHEHNLYKILAEFLWNEHRVYSKRIDEKRSSNTRGTNGNKWLYPDLVAMADLSQYWDQAIKNCVQQYSDKKARLWSFEVKVLINSSNIRQSFFQTISNSSWANYSYLVAARLDGADTKQELNILSALHGIGFILLNVEEPSESQIIIPAKEREDIDWDTANRLVQENKDFKEFIEEVTSFYQTGKTKASDWGLNI